MRCSTTGAVHCCSDGQSAGSFSPTAAASCRLRSPGLRARPPARGRPFSVARTPVAHSAQVRGVSSGAATYGHRFLTTSGRAGRAIKVRSFDEYRKGELENFVILERAERRNKIARELAAEAQRLQGRVSRTNNHETGLLLEVPTRVKCPSALAG